MQIICPNCGSESPIEAGSLVTQTRIVCARCAVEFAAELSDEQQAAPVVSADERGIELFCAADVGPAVHARPVLEVAVAQTPEVAPAGEVAAVETVVESAHEALPAARVPHADVEVETVATSADRVSAEAGDVYEVLSLPEEAVLTNEAVTRAAAAEAYLAAGSDHSNVLEDVFAAWNHSRESKPEADAHSVEAADAAEDYVTTPLSPDYANAYEAAAREEQQPAERPSAEVAEAPTAAVLEATTNETVRQVEADADDAAERADDERESAGASYAGVSVPPRAAAAQSFDAYGLGVRLMRVSPLWLLVSGLTFISFVVFCNWFFVPANLAQAETSRRPASRRNEATNRSSASTVSAADPAPAQPDASNGGAPRAELPGEGEVVNASLKVEEPTPATPAPTAATPAPTVEPTPAPKAEQPKAAEAAAPQPAPDGKFTVQVGSYNVAVEAEARAANLRSAGQPVRVVEVEIPKRGKWYRVYVGGFASRTDAESHGKALRERGLAESYIATESR